MATPNTSNDDILELIGYIKRMESRLHVLQKVSDAISANIEKSTAMISEKKKGLFKDLDEIKNEVAEMKEQIRILQKVILQMINVLKSSVKVDEYERFKKRMDIWAPESFVTRNEVSKVLDEL